MNAYLRLGPNLNAGAEEHVKRPVVVTVNEFDEAALRQFTQDFSRAHETGQSAIPIVIDSFGGSPYTLLGMLAVIDSSALPVVTIVEGKAMSCGAMLFAFGTERYIAPHAAVMLHDLSSEIEGKTADLRVDSDETARLQNLLFARMAQQCKKPPTYFGTLLDRNKHADLYLTAEDAKRHGLATHIGVPFLVSEVTVTHTLRLLTASETTREVKKTNKQRMRRAPSQAGFVA